MRWCPSSKSAPARRHVAVAGGVDANAGADRLAARLSLDDDALYGVPLHQVLATHEWNRSSAPASVQRASATTLRSSEST